ALPSLHGKVFGAFTQPVAGSHESVVHTLASLQLIGGPPAQAPPAHVSAVVQALPSSQDRVFGVPAHTPAAQVSPEVQGLRSSHGKVFGAFTQPVAGSHESVVHTLASLQLIGGPPAQAPPAHVSAVVQALPSSQDRVFGVPAHTPAAQVSPEVQGLRSSHGTVLGVFTQPVAGSHVSVVHTLPSTQLGGGPPTQTPPAQVSAVVQALPSLQGSVFGAP